MKQNDGLHLGISLTQLTKVYDLNEGVGRETFEERQMSNKRVYGSYRRDSLNCSPHVVGCLPSVYIATSRNGK